MPFTVTNRPSTSTCRPCSRRATSAQTVTAPDGLTVEPPTRVDGKVTAWISGGTTGKVYRVTCQITTDSGRIDERSITIRVIER